MLDYMVAAIKSLRPNSEFSYTNDDYSTIKFDVIEGEPPTLKEVHAEILRIKALQAKEAADNAKAKSALLERLGITVDEAALLLS